MKRREIYPIEKLPDSFVALLDEGRWQHPGDDVLKRAVPFIADPLTFLDNKE